MIPAGPEPRRLSFPKSVRLLRSEEFQRCNRGGRRRTRHLVVRFAPRPGEVARFGLAVSRKVGNAVVRNRVKRWLREAIRLERGDLREMDVVFIALPGAGDSDFSTLRGDVVTLLQHVKRAA